MPQVGKGKRAKHFAYTPKGIAAARKAAKKAGVKMTRKKK